MVDAVTEDNELSRRIQSHHFPENPAKVKVLAWNHIQK
jgi:hypothetical protein